MIVGALQSQDPVHLPGESTPAALVSSEACIVDPTSASVVVGARYGDGGQGGGSGARKASLPLAVALAFGEPESTPIDPEQARFERILRTDTPLFVNPLHSRFNCSECAIALDARFGGDRSAVARDETLRAIADRSGGSATAAFEVMLEQPEVVRTLTSRDDAVPELAALFRGETTFAALREAGRPIIEHAVALLFADDPGAAAAVAEVKQLPHVQLMTRATAKDYSIQEVAGRLELAEGSIQSFGSDNARLWVELPVWELGESFDSRRLLDVAAGSRESISALRSEIRRWEAGSRGVLSFVAANPETGQAFSHLLNIVVPNTTRRLPGGGTYTQGPAEFVVDGQLGHAYHLENFLRFTYPRILVADLLKTSDTTVDGTNNNLYRRLFTDEHFTQQQLARA